MVVVVVGNETGGREKGVMKTRVCLIDDDDSLREDVVRAVGSGLGDFDITAFERPSRLFRAMDGGQRFDVALVDLGLPEMSGEVVIRELRRRHAGMPALAFTVRDDDAAVFSALRAGASGYITKQIPVADLVEALRAAARGAAPLSPNISHRVIAKFWIAGCPTAAIGADLTVREREVLELVCNSASYREVASVLGISQGTVQTHIKNIYRKLGVTSKAEAVRMALSNGFVAHE